MGEMFTGAGDEILMAEIEALKSRLAAKEAKAAVWDNHGLVIGGPDDGKIVTATDYLKDGYVVGSNKDMKFHEYNVYERPDGTKFFLYSGSRRHLNG